MLPGADGLDGQPVPPSFQLPLAQIKASGAKLLGTRRTFKKRGQSGLEISDLWENLAVYADLAGLGPGRYNLPVRVDPMKNVTIQRVQPSQLDVRLRQRMDDSRTTSPAGLSWF